MKNLKRTESDSYDEVKDLAYSSGYLFDDFFDDSTEQIILSKEAEEEIIQNMEKFAEESDRESGEAQIAASKIYLTD